MSALCKVRGHHSGFHFSQDIWKHFVDVLGLEVLCLEDVDGERVLGWVVSQAAQELAKLLLHRRVEVLPVLGLGGEVNLKKRDFLNV